MNRSIVFLLALLVFPFVAQSKTMVQMPYPVRYLSLHVERLNIRMAYIDVVPDLPNGQTVVLLHGKNFNGWYWTQTVDSLSARGYRVVVPDQIGFGNSDYPDVHYSFHLMAANTRQLLDTLHIDKVIMVGHSMGGMLAARFSLLYPERVSKLILENPIGLEDYRFMVPYTSPDQQYQKELKATYKSYLDYQKTYYPVWKPEYEQLVAIQAIALSARNFKEIAFANALTYEMIYEQPVCYEFARIRVPTLLIIGQADRTIVGKALMEKDAQQHYGQYPALGKKVAAMIPGAKLAELSGIGHIPHIQDFKAFWKVVVEFL